MSRQMKRPGPAYIPCCSAPDGDGVRLERGEGAEEVASRSPRLITLGAFTWFTFTDYPGFDLILDMAQFTRDMRNQVIAIHVYMIFNHI